MAYRVRVAKPGQSIYGSSANQVLDSDYPVFNVVTEGTGTGNQTITNPLGVASAFFVWTKQGWKANSYKLFHNAYMTDSNGSLNTNVGVGVDYKYIITQRKLNNAICTATPGITGPQMVIADGADYNTATWDEIIFHSGKRTLQIWGRGTIDITVTTDNTYYENSAVHGFSFTPAFIAYASMDYGGWYERFTICDGTGSATGGGTVFEPLYNINYTAEVCSDGSRIWARAKARKDDGEGTYDTTAIITIRVPYIIIGAIT